MRRAVHGRAKLALCFQIPSHASLHGILKAQRSLCCANGPALAPRSEIFGEKHGVAIGLQAGMYCEKASVSPLASVFSITNPSFAQRISPYFLFSYLTRSFPLISPCGPTSGCSTAHLPRCLVVFIRAIRGLKMLYSLRE